MDEARRMPGERAAARATMRGCTNAGGDTAELSARG
jgi:hypothetical protein